MEKITTIAQEALLPCIRENGIYADFTLGEGNDTKFLLQYPIAKVYAFETQSDVVKHVQSQLHDKRVCFLNIGHEHAKEYISETIDGGIFNFGYYPKGDKLITTVLETSQQAVIQALDLLKVKGRLVLVCYPGHAEGKKEADYFSTWVKQLPSRNYAVCKITMENKVNCPFVIVIERVR